MESISDGCVGVDSFEFLRQLRGCLGEMEGNHLQTIDVVAGIPSQEGIHFMEKKKKRCERSSAGVESTVCAHGRQARILTSE